MVQQLVQGGATGATGVGGGLVIGRRRQREFRHDVPVDRGRGVAEVAGEFGAELARAIRVGLAPSGPGPYGSRGSSELTWYAFAVTYARDHWVGRAATTRNETSEALALVTRAMLWDVPGRPGEDVLHRALRSWAFLGPGASEHDIPARERLVLAWVAKASRPLVDLHDPVVARSVLEALRLRRDGSAAAPERCGASARSSERSGEHPVCASAAMLRLRLWCHGQGIRASGCRNFIFHYQTPFGARRWCG
ncbi:hypothetical protein [Streptomyces sp. CBMA29]|uniref:hypothetical protein n=1 Tax=Streptomyces sp. CBMA29 TaxID=1896314 RepID=UPI001661C41A|nr:hypothetical protein [Streptomyces sp. CBMA29]